MSLGWFTDIQQAFIRGSGQRVPLNWAVSFEKKQKRKYLVHGLRNKAIELNSELCQLLSLRGQPIAMERLPDTLRSFVTTDVQPWIDEKIASSGPWHALNKYKSITIFVHGDSPIFEHFYCCLLNLIDKFPFLLPKHPFTICIGDSSAAYKEAKKWHESHPHLGAATVARSLIFFNTYHVRRLVEYKMLNGSIGHELFHACMGDYSLFLPCWLEEGLAETVGRECNGSTMIFPMGNTNDYVKQIDSYIRSGIWGVGSTPLIDPRIRDVTRKAIVKFVWWLLAFFHGKRIFQALATASLLEPWEARFKTLTGSDVYQLWREFCDRYLDGTHS